jgi:hypothetical protein
MAILDVPEDLVGKKIHRLNDWAASRALLALVTGLEVNTACSHHL